MIAKAKKEKIPAIEMNLPPGSIKKAAQDVGVHLKQQEIDELDSLVVAPERKRDRKAQSAGETSWPERTNGFNNSDLSNESSPDLTITDMANRIF